VSKIELGFPHDFFNKELVQAFSYAGMKHLIDRPSFCAGGSIPDFALQMLSIRSDFTKLEQSILAAICEMYAEDCSALEAQLSSAVVFRRENTGAGFYSYLTVERSSCAAIGGPRLRCGPAAKVETLNHGMGFILWFKEGYADCLEGFSYGESTSDLSFERIGFEIVRGYL
jgi:hypothetical protein